MSNLLANIGLVNRYVCFLILAFNVYTSATLTMPISRPLNQGGPWKYLTIWNLVLQTIYFGLATIMGWFKSPRRNKKSDFLDTMFQSLVLPLGMCVTTMFWGIYMIDSNLILPDAIRPYFPEWHNQSIHTLVLIGPLIELICINHRIPKRSTGLKLFSVFMVAYFLNVHYFGLTFGNWVYPFLNAISYPMRLLFFIASGGFAITVYLLCEKLHLTIRSTIKH